jgi:hypothetical protein
LIGLPFLAGSLACGAALSGPVHIAIHIAVDVAVDVSIYVHVAAIPVAIVGDCRAKSHSQAKGDQWRGVRRVRCRRSINGWRVTRDIDDLWIGRLHDNHFIGLGYDFMSGVGHRYNVIGDGDVLLRGGRK